jgi:predicted esterase
VIATLVVLAAAGIGCGGDGSTASGEPGAGGVQRDVPYRHTRDHAGKPVTLRLDVYRPHSPAGRRPAIVWLFGGGFVAGNRADMEPYAKAMAARGFVSATADYRLATQAQIRTLGFDEVRRAAQGDGAAAVRWIQRHARGLGVDRRRVFIGGYSAGAVTALGVATGAGGAIGGGGEAGGGGAGAIGGGGEAGGGGAGAAAAHPAGAVIIAGRVDPAAIDLRDAPLLWFHGRDDRTVPFEEAATACRTARRRGLECLLLPQPGGHEIVRTRFEVIVRRATAWLRRH